LLTALIIVGDTSILWPGCKVAQIRTPVGFWVHRCLIHMTAQLTAVEPIVFAIAADSKLNIHCWIGMARSCGH